MTHDAAGRRTIRGVAVTPLRVAIAVVVAVLLVVLIRLGYQSSQRQYQGKTESADHCTSAIRDDIRATFADAGHQTDSTRFADAATFSGVDTSTRGLSDADRETVRNVGRAPGDVTAGWWVSGAVAIPAFAQSGAQYGPNNTFTCHTAVFKDRTIVILSRKIN